MLFDFENDLYHFLYQKIQNGELQWDSPTAEAYEEWAQHPASSLGGRSPRDFFSGIEKVDELIGLFIQYVTSPRVAIPRVLVEELGRRMEDSLPILLELLDSSIDSENEQGIKGGAVSVSLVDVLNSFESPQIIEPYLKIITENRPEQPLIDHLVSGLRSLGEMVRGQALRVLKEASTPELRANMAAVLCRTGRDPETMEWLTRLYREGDDLKAFYAERLGDYGDQDVLPILQEDFNSPELGIDLYDSLRLAFSRLGAGNVWREDLEQARLAETDPGRLAVYGVRLVTQGELTRAEAVFRRQAAIAPEAWGTMLNLAEVCWEQEKHDEARDYIKKVLDGIHRQWRDNPANLEYLWVEQVERVADQMLGDTSRLLRRWVDYAFGALHFYGVLDFRQLYDAVSLGSSLTWQVLEKDLLPLMEADDRFDVLPDGLIACNDVEDIDGLLDIRVDGVELKPWNLSAFQLVAEGRVKDLWSKEEHNAAQALDSRVREFVGGIPILRLGSELSVPKLQIEMRNASHPNMVLDKVFAKLGVQSQEEARRVGDQVLTLWNHTPRWDLCGWSPHEISLATRQMEQQSNVFAKVGRNDPCPCGSGKKFKKCCGAGLPEEDAG